jgi:UDP-N-acetylglucosamine 1-carboxyvinyltransferase
MGARIAQNEGFIRADAKNLQGAKIYLDLPSVGATENLMMAATLAQGTTVIENAAKEPEIVDLAELLTAMGARIQGAGGDTVVVEGVKCLHGVQHQPIPDRIEAATFMVATAATNGNVFLRGARCDHRAPSRQSSRRRARRCWRRPAASACAQAAGSCRCICAPCTIPAFHGRAGEMMALLCTASGTSVVNETIFENGFMHVTELRRMGADINVQDRVAIVEGVPMLYGAKVNATDLRAGAAMAIAGLMAHGETDIHDPHHIQRGYERFDEKLKALGANICVLE